MKGTPQRPSFVAALRFWCKLGRISFGGTAAHIAIMHDELVEKRQWISDRSFLHALSQCMILPGPEAQQLAIYVGGKLHGKQVALLLEANARDGAGYGYLWWINGFGLSVKNFYALGALGKFLIVIPDRDLVVVLLNHTEFPPNLPTMPLAEYNKLPSVSVADMKNLLGFLLAAQPH